MKMIIVDGRVISIKGSGECEGVMVMTKDATEILEKAAKDKQKKVKTNF